MASNEQIVSMLSLLSTKFNNLLQKVDNIINDINIINRKVTELDLTQLETDNKLGKIYESIKKLEVQCVDIYDASLIALSTKKRQSYIKYKENQWREQLDQIEGLIDDQDKTIKEAMSQ